MAKPKKASSGIVDRIKNKPDELTYAPDSVDRVVRSYVKRRLDEMMDFRKGLGIEKKWQEADEEYIPHELDFGTTRKRFETDQDSGLRSRMVPVGDKTQQWRSAASAPTLLAKIQTALSIIIDQMPEAELVALSKKYAESTDIAYAMWKRNWSITDAKEKLKAVIFNLMKYGWAPQRTYPRRVAYKKRILVERDPENPENDKYEEKELEWFNDVDREPLDVFKTWIDELTKPYDMYSMNESYYELDYSYDSAKVEFGDYPNFKYVKPDSAMVRNEEKSKSNRTEPSTETKKRRDIVTIGFFESRHKDLFVIYNPKDNIVIYTSPLPNDDGYLSISQTLWMLRKAKLPYGVSMWEVIRQNKQLYDKMKNMTMDQLVLSIMKFGFFAGTNTNIGDGLMEIVPGQARQLTSSTGKPEINWMEIPGPGAEAWKGIEALQDMMDSESGISAMLEGDDTPGEQTLGELLHRKEAALKRLKVPVDNIAWLIEQDAYITLSWMSQIYSIPTIQEFLPEDDMSAEQKMQAFEQEEMTEHYELFPKKNEAGEQVGIIATYLPQIPLHLEDREGKLFESKESKYFQVGKDIQPKQLRWKGIFKVIPRSIIDSSQELTKASKMELFNIIVPILVQPPEMMAKAISQVIKANEEDPKDWLPDAYIQYLENPTPAAPAGGPTPGAQGAPGGPQGGSGPVFIQPGQGAPTGAVPAGAPAQGQSMQAAAGTAPNTGAQTVVPPEQISAPEIKSIQAGARGGLFNRKL